MFVEQLLQKRGEGKGSGKDYAVMDQDMFCFQVSG